MKFCFVFHVEIFLNFFLLKLFIFSWKKKQIADGFLEELKKTKNAIKSSIEIERNPKTIQLQR